MQFIAILEKFDSNLWYYHIKIPTEIAQSFLKNKNKRVLCSLNGDKAFQCAIIAAGEDVFFINMNKEIRTKYKLIEGSEIKVKLEKDESKYGLPMPEELAELFKIDEEGNTIFHSLTPGKQRNLLYIINKVKSSDKRLEKALIIVDYLKANNGKIDFKVLNEALRSGNRFV